MALDIQEKHAVVQGMPLVQVSDKHFWFEWPPLVLYLIHYVLFQVLLNLQLIISLYTDVKMGLAEVHFEKPIIVF